MITPATPSAAKASSEPSQGILNLTPNQAPVIPRTTTNVLQTSVEKCSASASRASLGYFFATRPRARARTKSIPIVSERMTMASEARAHVLPRMKEQPVESFPDDVERGQQQQACLDECGKAFDFPVAVEMLRVRRLVRDSHGKIGDDRGHQIEDRMQRFRENTEAAGDRREKHLQGDKHDGRTN